jgi:Protein of unknown function (Ytp1)
MLSTKIHAVFGYTLVLAGVARVVEICFILRDQHRLPEDDVRSEAETATSAFQHLTPFLLVLGGCVVCLTVWLGLAGSV